MLYPLRFIPVYFEKVWGDRRLESFMHRQLPPEMAVGESWEVSDHPHGRSVIANGPDCGKTLHEVMERNPAALLGARVIAQHDTVFPLLVKFIDAGEELSVQVHPSDAYAAEHEGEMGKTEMWYVLHADPDACLIVGLNNNVTRDDFTQALAHGDPADLLYHMPVKTGDSIFIPAGRIHAIMPGLLICEIQQNSDTTYRLYDWGRVGLDGKPRELHVAKAMAVTNWTDYEPAPSVVQIAHEGENRKTVLATCPYFTVEKYDLTRARAFTTDGGSFHILNCVAGQGALQWMGGSERLTLGDSILIPAEITNFTLQPDGDATLLLSYVP